MIEPELEKIDLKIILINSLVINADKVQEVTDKYLKNKPYISIFCFTETKDSGDFITKGIKLHTNQREKKEKKGGLAIGYLINNRIKLEKIPTKTVT